LSIGRHFDDWIERKMFLRLMILANSSIHGYNVAVNFFSIQLHIGELL